MQKKKNKTEKATFIYHFSMFYGYTFAGYHSRLHRHSSFTSSTCILCPHLIQHPDNSLIEDVRADDL